jgi:hypothetical protein
MGLRFIWKVLLVRGGLFCECCETGIGAGGIVVIIGLIELSTKEGTLLCETVD